MFELPRSRKQRYRNLYFDPPRFDSWYEDGEVVPSIRSGQAGMVLSYGLTLSGSLYYVVFNVLMIETNMVAAERLQHYTTLPGVWPLAHPTASECMPNRFAFAVHGTPECKPSGKGSELSSEV